MSAQTSLDPIISTTHGKVRGTIRKTVYGDDFFCFDGVPYAKRPLNELRFRAPQELEPWQGVRDCTEPAPKPLQYNRYTGQIEGSEDCLYLNIYVKKLRTAAPLPVMVYLHGGVNRTGEASRNAWGPDYFMMKEIILITIGYRLGPLGFLSLSDPELKIPGNAGLKDQIHALKWINANCASFNGDPENITLFGHSSGATSVHLFQVSPQAAGLYHKAILMSGTPYANNPIQNTTYRLAKFLGYDGDENNSKGIYDFLMKFDAKELINRNLLTDEERNRGLFVDFQPCIEPYASNDSVLLDSLANLLPSCWSNKIPVMIGNTTNENLLAYKTHKNNQKLHEIYQTHPEYLLPIPIQYNPSCDLELQRKLAKKVIKLHFVGENDFPENIDKMMEFISYRDYFHPSHRYMRTRRSKKNFAPTYYYRFDFDSPDFNLYRIKHLGPHMRGVAHVDDLSYIFWMPQSFKLDKSRDEFKLIQRMVGMWTSFASNSDPNCSELGSTVWKPLDRNNPQQKPYCLNISNELSFIEWPEEEKCPAWDEIYTEANLNVF